MLHPFPVLKHFATSVLAMKINYDGTYVSDVAEFIRSEDATACVLSFLQENSNIWVKIGFSPPINSHEIFDGCLKAALDSNKLCSSVFFATDYPIDSGMCIRAQGRSYFMRTRYLVVYMVKKNGMYKWRMVCTFPKQQSDGNMRNIFSCRQQ